MSESEALREHGGLWLTPEGSDALHAELEHLTMVKRPEIAARIRESQEHGEFSEDNSELDEVKFEQAFIENRIGELKSIFSSAHVIDPDQIPTDYVGIGSHVSLVDVEFGDKFDVRLVAGIEADPNRDLISADSPMGIAIADAKVGDTVDVHAPGGLRHYTIKKIFR